jgi:hypothetical protein
LLQSSREAVEFCDKLQHANGYFDLTDDGNLRGILARRRNPTDQQMPTPRRRRWFQFGLRTMFVVVTLVAVFFGMVLGWFNWARRWDAERNAFLEQHFGDLDAPVTREAYLKNPSNDAPWLLRPLHIVNRDRWAGTGWMTMVFFDDDPEELLEQARGLFPETRITRGFNSGNTASAP